MNSKPLIELKDALTWKALAKRLKSGYKHCAGCGKRVSSTKPNLCWGCQEKAKENEIAN